MVTKGLKKGYSLLEACIVMLIVSIFIAVAANVLPHKPKPQTESEVHGRYECYYSGGNVYQQTFVQGNPSSVAQVSECSFTPPKYIKYLVINAVGGAAASGGSSGEFASTFYSNADSAFVMTLGTAGSGTSNGSPTSVYLCTNSDCSENKEILTAKGGEYTSGSNGYLNTTISDVQTCTAELGPQITDSGAYACSKSPICEIENDMIKVSYCRTNELYKTEYLPYKRNTTNYSASQNGLKDTKFIIDSPYPSSGKWNNSTGTLIYYDASLWDDYGMEPPNDWNPATNTTTPSLYKLTLKLKVHNSTTSLMENYIKMLQLSSGIASAKPGSISSNTPKPGAVLILW